MILPCHTNSVFDFGGSLCLFAVSSVDNRRVANCLNGYQPYGYKNDKTRPLSDYSHQVVLREDRIVPSGSGRLFAWTIGPRKALPMPHISDPSRLPSELRHFMQRQELSASFELVKAVSGVIYQTINEHCSRDLRKVKCAELLAVLSDSLSDRVSDLEKQVQSFVDED